MSTSRLFVDPKYIERAADNDKFSLQFARIESHFFVHGGWFEHDGWLIENAEELDNISAVIVQGRYDVVCPCKSAWELKQKWSSAKLIIVPDAGHSAKEDGIIRELVHATDYFRTHGKLDY